DSSLILIHHSSLSTAAGNYAAYRSSMAGGSNNVISANVEDLYWQFGGGVEKHIIAIRRFADYIYDNSTTKPVGLFLMGKGIREADYNSATSDGPGTRKTPARFQQSLIPSFGHPSSDPAITSGLNGSTLWTPLIPTGRISARTNSELQDYLDKVIQYEAAQDPFDIYDSPNKDWQKQIIHFGGGSDLAQQTQFQTYLNNMKSKAESELFGGN